MTLTFYATVTQDDLCRPVQSLIPADACLLFPASSFRKETKFQQPRIPSQTRQLAADCGGFVATFRWGDYRYSPAEYVDWLRGWSRPPEWAATMDYCCEDEITNSRPGIVRQRQDRTTEMAHHFWNTYRGEAWSWTPTIQGWRTGDYERHAAELAPLIREMKAHYGRNFRVGIGTLCRRASVREIREVVHAVAAVLPDTDLHLWGVKLSAIQKGLPSQVGSVDSAAWNGLFGRGRSGWKASGLTQSAYVWKVAYPSYIAKVQAAISRETVYQSPLFYVS